MTMTPTSQLLLGLAREDILADPVCHADQRGKNPVAGGLLRVSPDGLRGFIPECPQVARLIPHEQSVAWADPTIHVKSEAS